MAFIVGGFLAWRSWTGRYAIRSFAGICPRCGAVMSLDGDRTVNLPLTLTCYHCHFEPKLEVHFAEGLNTPPIVLDHQADDCVGLWEIRWLADERFVFCPLCHGGAPARRSLLERAEAENAAAILLNRLSNEGRPLI